MAALGRRSPALQPFAKPTFRSSGITVTQAKREQTAAAVPSVEALSTRIVSVSRRSPSFLARISSVDGLEAGERQLARLVAHDHDREVGHATDLLASAGRAASIARSGSIPVMQR